MQPQNNIRQAIKLFDCLISPILTYTSVIWGPLYAKNMTQDTIYEICNDSPLERLNLKLCKFLLGVHGKSTNAAVRGEMGRYPLLINVLNLANRYHMRVRSLDSDSLVKLSCMDQFIQDYEGSWTSIMDKLYMNFYGNQSLKEKLEELYCEKWLSYINSCHSKGKLSVYANIKKLIQT